MAGPESGAQSHTEDTGQLAEAALREQACCRSEPECILCPLLPQNSHLTLKELKAMGLHAFLDEVGI